MSGISGASGSRFWWIKPGVWGGVVGAVAVSILGFSAFGWTTAGTAQRTAMTQANAAVASALTPFCVTQAQADADIQAKLAELTALTSSSRRQQFVMEAGWATMPGAEAPDRALAASCAASLIAPPPA